VDKVEEYVTGRDDVEPTLRSFQEMISKYQFMEVGLQKRVAGLKEKIPDIQKTLDTVQFLKTRQVRGETLSPFVRVPVTALRMTHSAKYWRPPPGESSLSR
jgi:hypothetical protein